MRRWLKRSGHAGLPMIVLAVIAANLLLISIAIKMG
jgi:hypothetical protein